MTKASNTLISILTIFGIACVSAAEARVSHHHHTQTTHKHSRTQSRYGNKPVVGVSGKASIYSDHFNGKKTATGERFHQNQLTAASPTLPLGSKVKVTNKKNGKSVVVKVNDKQPKSSARILDLSKSAAGKLGAKDGVMPVTTKVVGK